MSEGKKEVTKIIERLELLEEKYGITISGLYVTCEYLTYTAPPCHQIYINFDVTDLNGGRLERNVYIKACAYNSAGQLLGTDRNSLNCEKFMGFSPEQMYLQLDQEPVRIRLFPTESSS